MTIKREYLTVNEYSRPGRKLKALKAIVMHWTANANANEDQNAWYFEVKKTGMSGYGSAHFIVGQSGNIRQCIPEDEVAYHCGSSQPDPESGKIAIYYGAADSYVGLAFTQFEDIVAYIKEHSKLSETDTEIGIR